MTFLCPTVLIMKLIYFWKFIYPSWICVCIFNLGVLKLCISSGIFKNWIKTYRKFPNWLFYDVLNLSFKNPAYHLLCSVLGSMVYCPFGLNVCGLVTVLSVVKILIPERQRVLYIWCYPFTWLPGQLHGSVLSVWTSLVLVHPQMIYKRDDK